MSGFELRPPSLLGGAPDPASQYHLLPPEQLQLHMDPALSAGLGGTGLVPPAGAALNAFSHYTDPPAIPAAPSPFSSEINTVPNGQPNAGAYSDGEARATLHGPAGLDFSAGVTGEAGGDLGLRAGVARDLGNGMRLGLSGGVSGVNGDSPTPNVGLKLDF